MAHTMLHEMAYETNKMKTTGSIYSRKNRPTGANS